MSEQKRIVFLDYLRVFACLLVMLVHACEQYYFNAAGDFHIATRGDALALVGLDSLARASVPLFVMASAFLLFPLRRTTGEFFRRRFMRVVVPFVVWACVYTTRFGGDWTAMAFNFPMATGGHLWFVPMLLGLYLLMPLISPWAERVSEKELRGWILLWFVTTFFPFIRKLCLAWCGAPSFGAVPFLYGECPWNAFGTFHYVSGFVGYMLLGFWFRKFAPEMGWRKTLVRAVPLLAVGWVIVAGFFYFRIPDAAGYPVTRPYATAVDLEMSWEFCSFGVALTVLGYFLVLRRFKGDGAFYRMVIRPLSEASYGTYLLHILVLVELAEFVKPALPTPVAIPALALATFLSSSVVSLTLRRLPLVGRWICG